SLAALLQLVAGDDGPRGLLNTLQHRQEGLRVGPGRTRLEILGGAGGGNLFGNRQAHKVVERRLRRLGHGLRFLQEGVREVQGIVTHERSLRRNAPGRSTSTPKVRAAGRKSRGFTVTMVSARPLTASSNTISSSGSDSWGRHWKKGVHGVPTAASMSSRTSTSCKVRWLCARMSSLFSTSSYSNINGTDSSTSKRRSGIKDRIAERYNSCRQYRSNVVAHISLEQPDETPDTVPAR